MFPTRQDTEYEFDLNPYESFMKRHLQHYGYYTGRNQNYRNAFQSYQEWDKTYDYTISSDSDDDTDDTDDQKDAQDNKLQEELLRTTQLVYSYEAGRMVPKLREPRNLYALAKEPGPQQAARWPADLQVQDNKVKHIRYVPTEPETFYKQTGLEKTPMVRGEVGGGKVVYNYDPKNSFFVRSRVGGSRTGCEQVGYVPKSKEDTTLVFESRFESGNLAKAVQVGEYDYELWLRYDLYTNKHTQWYYFRVSNTRANVKYRFTIVNFMKPDSLYNYGMKPLMYSEKDALQRKVGWVRSGMDIKYYRNNLRYETSRGDRPFYSQTWVVQMNHNHDTVYFSHCFPYTYTDLQDYLLEVSNDPIKSRICKQRVLCRTLAGNLVYVLTITSPSQNPEDIKHKKAVVVTSRVHPGESNSSWMMKGFLDYLTGNSADAKLLRDTFIFKIVPMLNPDGVIVGNYRCSLAGRDLNRNYKTVLKDSYPSVWHTKNMIRKLLQEREIIVYCDLHGHSRKQNVFIYGCENRHNASRRLKERIFPCMLSKNAPDKFSFNCCKFKVQKSKEGTGRIVMWNMGIMNSYTLEATFAGSTMGKKKGFHFTLADYESLGYHFCDTLLDFCDPDNTKCGNILADLEERLRLEILTKMEKEGLSPGDVDLSDFSSDMESSDGGSDSSVSDGPPVHLQFAAARMKKGLEAVPKKKKKLKSRKERDKQLDKEPPKPEKPISEPPEKKPVSSHPHGKQDKGSTQALRYSTSSKRPRSQDERTNNGIPIFVQERCDERQQKRALSAASRQRGTPPQNESDYLEALTAAYLRNGIPLLNEPVFVKLDPKRVPHFRYSGNKHIPGNLPFSLEGLCPHHEQTFAAQYVAHQLQGTGAHDGVKKDLRGGKLRKIRDKQQQDKDLAPSSEPPSGNSYFKIWKLFSRRSTDEPEVTVEDYLKSRQSNVPPLDRRQMPRHLVEVSAAQQRQQDMLQKVDKSNLIKQHPNPFDEKHTDGRKGDRPRARIPSATFVNYDTYQDDREDVDTEGSFDHSRRSGSLRGQRDKNGRKSRMGMHEEEESQVPRALSTNDVLDLTTTYVRQQPRVQSAHANEEMNNAMNSIRELKQSLATTAGQSSLSPTTGTYIRKLLKETSEEIDSLTSELQGDIEKERKLTKEIQHDRIDGKRKNRDDHRHPEAEQREVTLGPKSNTARRNKKSEVEVKQQKLYQLEYDNHVTVTSAPQLTRDDSGASSREERPCSEAASRGRSARSNRQVIEAVPTKISLMISSDHQDIDQLTSGRQWLPMYKTVRPPYLRPCNGKRK
ncbi:cytosolic carboxypeptidase 2-like isoform X1 [Haliotis rubra]|uniref:cytosolic carboxypeptidase 2-like isoform X1 n=1 Tax=Haliotis rubra TaxID=36100 RepID=UPI001EE4F349|nr:cytosolic carboxypeptidase 2-like isoform X1 [Haliotis rubra]